MNNTHRIKKIYAEKITKKLKYSPDGVQGKNLQKDFMKLNLVTLACLAGFLGVKNNG